MKSRASVIIVVKNDRGIAATLDALQPQLIKAQSDVIVVDSSLPETLADIRESHPWARWEQFPFSTVRTTPQQRNRGIELATSDVIVFIDANCIPANGWLEALLRRIDEGKSIVCGPVNDSSETNLVHYAPVLLRAKYVDVCTTINVGLKRDVIDRIGGFDPSFRFGQDVDFFWRASDAGFKIFYDPKVAISHDWGNASEQLGRAFQYGKSRAHLFKKHWATRRGQLLHEPHVWVYPVFILGLPLTIWFPFYPLLLLVPLLKNRDGHPFSLTLHHLTYGLGVLAGVFTIWA